MAFDLTPYINMSPAEVRALIADGTITKSTSGMAAGYVQANLICLPRDYAEEFREFARLNPQPCPVLEIFDGEPISKFLGPGANILSAIPGYNIYRNGVLEETVSDANPYWEEDMVGFLIGCSYSFEEALVRNDIEIRHMTQGTPVPMYRSTIHCKPYKRFFGDTVVSMRPMSPQDAQRAKEITEKMPRVHGGPVHMGDSSQIGIADVMKPDYGHPSQFKEGEIPVFWACGVTPQYIVENAKPPIAISHLPGFMFIGDILNTDIEAALAEQDQA